MVNTVFVRDTQSAQLVTVEGHGVPKSSQIAALAAFAPPSTLKTQSSQLVQLASVEGHGVARSSDIAILVAFKTGPREDFTQRAWTFDFDGHSFYVLRLGVIGTFVYDILTGQWQTFQTIGLPGWNMENGVVWQNRVMGGDNQNPVVWELAPESEFDDGFKIMTRVVTGGVPARNRIFARNDALRVTASVGTPDTPTATVSLRFSDDLGSSWAGPFPITLASGDFSQELAWRSLGAVRAPGRIYEITDIGGLVRIDGADVEIEGADDGS